VLLCNTLLFGRLSENEEWLQKTKSRSSAFVAPAQQRQGIGTETIRQLLARFGERRKPIVLTVLKNNPARRLYELKGAKLVFGSPSH
jgi:GNAT superfamily N-acetyltransferase